MAAQQIKFDLASPRKLVFSKPVAMATVPGSVGDYGVLSGHAPMATTLGAGVVAVYENDEHSVTARYFVSGGFCEVRPDYCAVMADQIVPVSELKRDALEAEIKTLSAETTPEAESQLALAKAKLQAIT